MITRLRALLARKFVRDTLSLQGARIITTALSALTSLIVWRVMGPERFGVYALAESFFALWTQLDLTGAATALYTRLGIAIGARDHDAIRASLGAYLKIGGVVTLGVAALVLIIGVPLSASVYGSSRIGGLAAGLAFAWLADTAYGYVLTVFGASRQIRTLALLSVINQGVLTLCSLVAISIDLAPEALVIARIVYAYTTLIIALIFYDTARRGGRFPVDFPTMLTAVGSAVRAPIRGYWRFGAANALDKNIAALFVQLPVQIVGIISGAASASYLSVALSGIANASILTSAVFDNVQAVVPQAVGRGDYARLRHNIIRVMVVLGVGALIIYGVLALIAPVVIPPLLGDEWSPAIAPLVVLTVYGAVSAVGGILGPLYRAFNIMRRALVAKIIGLVVALVVGIPLIVQYSAVGGAAMITLGLSVSVVITVAFVLPELKKRAKIVTAQPSP